MREVEGEFEGGGLMAQKGSWIIAKKEDAGRQRSVAPKRRRLNQIMQGHSRRKLCQQLAKG